MRRLLAALILCLLPMQWSFAALAQYCAHEKSPAAQQHLGHHDHEHKGSSGDKAPDESEGLNDIDCPTCHHLCGNTMLVASTTTLMEPSIARDLSPLQVCPYRSPDNPFRPPLVAGI